MLTSWCKWMLRAFILHTPYFFGVPLCLGRGLLTFERFFLRKVFSSSKGRSPTSSSDGGFYLNFGHWSGRGLFLFYHLHNVCDMLAVGWECLVSLESFLFWKILRLLISLGLVREWFQEVKLWLWLLALFGWDYLWSMEILGNVLRFSWGPPFKAKLLISKNDLTNLDQFNRNLCKIIARIFENKRVIAWIEGLRVLEIIH